MISPGFSQLATWRPGALHGWRLQDLLNVPTTEAVEGLPPRQQEVGLRAAGAAWMDPSPHGGSPPEKVAENTSLDHPTTFQILWKISEFSEF